MRLSENLNYLFGSHVAHFIFLADSTVRFHFAISLFWLLLSEIIFFYLLIGYFPPLECNSRRAGAFGVSPLLYPNSQNTTWHKEGTQ